ncbi:MAG TPA: hypothetical protein VHI78_10275 [Bacteroidales bacterium]|jgi:hypothetical protein|nr:hypothetical protein [Bacteroidales bacterium]
MNRRILIVCGVFYPQNTPRAFRATELSKELALLGHDVTVCFPLTKSDYSAFELEHNIKIRTLGYCRFKPIILKGGKIEFFLRRLLRRLMLMLFEWPDIELMFKVRNFLKTHNGYDLLISIAVPHPIHWGVALAWKKNTKVAKTWIADCGDPYMFSRMDTFKKMFYFQYLEKLFCRKCNYITVPFDDMKHQFYPEFRDKILTIPQGFNFNEVKTFKGEIKNSIPTFIFAGSIIPGLRDLDQLLIFLGGCKEDFLFINYTKQPEWYKKYKKYLDGKIELRDYIDRKDLVFELSKADFLVNVDSVFEFSQQSEAIPSKLIDYALAGRPILNIISDNLDKTKVLAFLSGDYSTARVIDISIYDINKVAESFLNLE